MAALLGAAMLGGCFLVYHPGDYVTGSGGAGGTPTTSGSTLTLSGTGGSALEAGPDAEPDAGPPRSCESPSTDPPCVGKTLWTAWPCAKDTGATGRALAVAVQQVANQGVVVDVAGAFTGGLELAGVDGGPTGAVDAHAETGFFAQIDQGGSALLLMVPKGLGDLRSVAPYQETGLAALGRRVTDAGSDGLLEYVPQGSPPSPTQVQIGTAAQLLSYGAAVAVDDTTIYAAGVLGGPFNGNYYCGSAAGSMTLSANSLFAAAFLATPLLPHSCKPVSYASSVAGAAAGRAWPTALVLHDTELLMLGTYQGMPPTFPGLTQDSGNLPYGFLGAITKATMAAKWGLTLTNTGGTAPLEVHAAALAGHRLYVAGSFTGTLDIGGTAIVAPPDTKVDGFLACIDLAQLNPELLWLVDLGGSAPGNRRITGVAAVAAGATDVVYVAGTAAVPVSFPGLANPACQDGGMFLARLEAGAAGKAGAQTRWVQCYGPAGGDSDVVRVAASDTATGTWLALAGARTGTIDLGKGIEGSTLQVPFAALLEDTP